MRKEKACEDWWIQEEGEGQREDGRLGREGRDCIGKKKEMKKRKKGKTKIEGCDVMMDKGRGRRGKDEEIEEGKIT